MREKWMRFVSLFLVGVLCCSIFAGCSSQVSETDNQGPEEISQGKVAQESVSIVQGENHLTLSSDEIFLEDIVNHLDAVVIDYGWATCNPSKMTRKDEHTLELSFEAEPASEDMEADYADDMGHVIVSGEQLQTGKAVSADFSIKVPVLTSHSTVARDASQLTFDMTLEHAELSQTIGTEDITLSKAFEGMALTNVERKSDTELSLTLMGEMKTENEQLVPYLEGGVAIKPEATTAVVAGYGEISLVSVSAYLTETPVFHDDKTLTVGVMLENCQWNSDVDVSQITLTGAFESAAVQKVVPSSENPQKLEVVLSTNQEEGDGVGSIVFSDKATNAGQTVGVDVQFDNAGFYVVDKSVTETKDKATLVISADSHGMQLNRTLSPEDLVLSDEFAQGTVEKVEQNEEHNLLITLSFSPEVFAEMDEYKGGTITLPFSCVESNFANIDDFPIVICVNMFKEKQNDTTEMADTADSTMMANALSIQPSAANAVSMQSLSSGDTTSLLCDFVGSSLKSLVTGGFSGVGSVISGKLLTWLGISGEAETMKKLNEIVDKLDSLTEQVNRLEQGINKLIDAVETSAFKEQMRDIQASVLKLKARVSGYQASLAAISKLDLGSEEYQNELKILADKINHTNGIDFHTETYALGEKILSDAAGTADGALKAHYDRITTMNNWEQQTYDERERFYLYSVGTYTQAVILDSIALEYIIETSNSTVEKSEAKSNLEDLKAQASRVSSLAEKYQVKRLKTGYNRNLRTGTILSTDVTIGTYDSNHRLVSNDEVYRLMNQKLIDNTKPGRYTLGTGKETFTLPDSLGLLTEKEAVALMKYSSKGSLLEELKSAGFTIPAGCPDTVMLRDVYIEKSLIRTGTSPTRYCFAVYYKPFLKTANNTYFSNMFVYASSEFVNNIPKTDFSKVSKLWEKDWTVNTIKSAVVKVVADDKDLYVV